MRLILLSVGSGKRLWPLSNDARSKQFLKVLESISGERESMVQRVLERLAHLNEMSGPVFKITNDPKVTTVGRFFAKRGLINCLNCSTCLGGI